MSQGKRIILVVVMGAMLLPASAIRSEYADVTINEKAEAEGMAPVIFPHWFHRIRYQCSTCHVDLGFKTKAGSNGITMDKISTGEYCGACHNDDIAWSVESCDLCHSGKSGLETGVKGSHQTTGPGNY
jgi:c(7)-type cytochrome triheme protein